jgi:chemotaxis protein MotB
MRKKKPPEHANHERWLISYADFITLLFAFFVVMFAISQVDTRRMGRFTEAFQKAVGAEIFPGRGNTLLPTFQETLTAGAEGENRQDESSKELPSELKKLKAALAALSQRSEILQGLNLLQRRNELVLRLSDNVFFDTGDDTLKEPARAMIHALAPELMKRDVDVRVEGHTDTRPISTFRFRSNWELSTARATAVIAKLASEGMPPSRLSAAGYGEFRPVADNSAEDGRKQNRRVDLVVSVDVGVDPEEPVKP